MRESIIYLLSHFLYTYMPVGVQVHDYVCVLKHVLHVLRNALCVFLQSIHVPYRTNARGHLPNIYHVSLMQFLLLIFHLGHLPMMKALMRSMKTHWF